MVETQRDANGYVMLSCKMVCVDGGEGEEGGEWDDAVGDAERCPNAETTLKSLKICLTFLYITYGHRLSLSNSSSKCSSVSGIENFPAAPIAAI